MLALLSSAAATIAIGQEMHVGAATTPTSDPSTESLADTVVKLDNGLLSIDARAVRLDAVLVGVASKAGFALELDEPLRELVTIRLENAPLRKGIERLLRGRSFVLRYAPPQGLSDATANRLWVFAGGTVVASLPAAENGDSPQPEPARTRLDGVAALAEGDTRAFAAALAPDIADESLAVRLEAVYALGEIGDPGSLALLELALADSDVRVRSEAIDALVEVGGEASAKALAIVLADPEPGLREDAVYALGELGGETAKRLLRNAAHDSDEIVREAAQDMLADLDAD